MKPKNLVVYKSNDLIEASYKLTLNEQRVILLCTGNIKSLERLDITQGFEISAKDFSVMCNVSIDTAYLALQEVTESLFNRYVIIYDRTSNSQDRDGLKFRWISALKPSGKIGKITIYFSAQIIPYLSELKDRFTKYELKHVGNMTSTYAIRLYELLMQWKTTGKREIEIDWLRKQFELDSSYNRMNNFKARVIEPAVKDINTHSDYTVSWTQRKTGRNVTHLTFTFGLKANAAAKVKKTSKKTQEPWELLGYKTEKDYAEAAHKKHMESYAKL